MKLEMRRIVLTSIIATVALACSEAAKDAAGDVMQDAGEALADAGKSLHDAGMSMLADAAMDTGNTLRDAGRAVTDAGREMRSRDSGTDSGSDAHAQEATGDGLPRPHWVLRDKDATALKAEVGPGYDAQASRFTTDDPKCVSVTYLENRSIGTTYRLSDGAMVVSCNAPPSPSTWRTSDYPWFLSSDCSGVGAYVAANSVVKVGTDFYYTDGAPQHVATYYTWNKTNQTCQPASPTNGQDMWAFKLVPSTIVSLLNAAPYALELVY